jgi:hypothetical protein
LAVVAVVYYSLDFVHVGSSDREFVPVLLDILRLSAEAIGVVQFGVVGVAHQATFARRDTLLARTSSKICHVELIAIILALPVLSIGVRPVEFPVYKVSLLSFTASESEDLLSNFFIIRVVILEFLKVELHIECVSSS